MMGCVRLKAPGCWVWGSLLFPQPGGPREEVPKGACITACHNRASKGC